MEMFLCAHLTESSYLALLLTTSTPKQTSSTGQRRTLYSSISVPKRVYIRRSASQPNSGAPKVKVNIFFFFFFLLLNPVYALLLFPGVV